jgi:NO-binding membrane sensor protein with MHYT domain
MEATTMTYPDVWSVPEGEPEKVILHQTWNYAFIAFAYMIAGVSSYSAVHLLDHGLWRAEELKKAAIIKHPDILAALMLSIGAVWCMHFVGMAAVTIDDTPVCFNWPITMGSLAAVTGMMLAAIKVAGNDVFASPDRLKILEDIVGNNYVSEQEALWAVTRVTYFHKLHFLAGGSLLAASGAIVMHYTGMMAQQGPFHKEWDVGLIAASAVAAIVICFAGFWIIFRLRWKIKQLWLRYVSAAVIAVAVCCLHFFGMFSVTYVADDWPDQVCHSASEKNGDSPNAWSQHQMVVVAIGIVVPAVAFLISNVINQELILAYEVTAKTNAIVSSLFPAQVRDRMLADDKSKLLTILSNDDDSDSDGHKSDARMPYSKPIADLYTDTTVMVSAAYMTTE